MKTLIDCDTINKLAGASPDAMYEVQVFSHEFGWLTAMSGDQPVRTTDLSEALQRAMGINHTGRHARVVEDAVSVSA